MSTFWQKLNKPFTVLAPMEGVTDFIFRELISTVGKPDVLFTEFTSSEALFSRGFDRTIKRFDFSEKQRPLVAQIWGTKPETFYKTAKFLEEKKFDGIDINAGCPDRNVVKRGSGAALIKNPQLLSELIQALKEGAPNTAISVKTRLGVEEIVTESWMEFLLNQKLDALSIHLRTAEEKSMVPAHYDELEMCMNLRDQISKTTQIIANGDVKTFSDIDDLYSKYKIDGAMIGRGIFLNPFLFDRTTLKHTTREYLEMLLKHTKMFVDYYGDTRNFDDMKKFFKVYVREFVGATDLKIKLMETHSYLEIEELVLEFLNKENL